MTSKLLTRDEFRRAVFARDHKRCVVCSGEAVDAHHILERRLWPDGGYYLDNGVSLCAECHLLAEATHYECTFLRERASIAPPIHLPPQLDDDQTYDKWGNPILDSGQRLRGELFDDESVQKILAPVLRLFTNRVKYPRTYHLPWSGRMSKDDRAIGYDEMVQMFAGRDVVVTAKMDGENTTWYRDGMHARAVDGPHRPAQEFVRAMHGAIAHDIPDGWRICGENLYARHALTYKNLTSYFQIFSVWNERNECLSWADTKAWAELLGLKTVPVMFCGAWDEATVLSLRRDTVDGDPCEGYVVRTTLGFRYRDFRRCVAKYVRPDHKPRHGGGPLVKNQLHPEKTT